MAKQGGTQVTRQAVERELAMANLMLMLEQEGNFVGLYDTAIEKAEDETVVERLEEFREDHVRHGELIAQVLLEQFKVKTPPLAPTPFGRTMAGLLDQAEGDDDLLRRFLVTEDLSRRTYFGVSRNEMPEPVARVVQQALEDEERHYAWAVERVGAEVVPLE